MPRGDLCLRPFECKNKPLSLLSKREISNFAFSVPQDMQKQCNNIDFEIKKKIVSRVGIKTV